MTSNQTAIKVAIIEDRREIREGLARLIDFSEGFRCAAQFGSMEEALPRFKADTADVVLCDIGLPGMNGIEGIKRLKEKFPDLPSVMLTIYDDDDRIFDALCAGACGYLLKKTPPAKLVEGLREAIEGGSPMSPKIARRVVALFREFRAPECPDYNLTPHETRLLKLLVAGHNYTTAAAEIGVSYNTINFHMKSIYAKLQVHSKAEAVALALRNQIVK